MNRICDNTAFRAKLDIRQIAGSKTRWHNIAKEFELITKKYPDDTLELCGSFDMGLSFIRTKDGKDVHDRGASLLVYPFTKELEKLKDSEIAGKLKKLFNLQRKIDIINEEVGAFKKKYLIKSNIPIEAVDEFYSSFDTTERALIERHLKADKFLHSNSSSIEIA